MFSKIRRFCQTEKRNLEKRFIHQNDLKKTTDEDMYRTNRKVEKLALRTGKELTFSHNKSVVT